MLDEAELARVLHLYPVLHELPATLQHSFRDSAYTARLQAGQVVFDSGHFMPFFFLMTSGSIRVTRQGVEREILLYRIQPGEICVLSAGHLLAEIPYQAMASTEQDVTGVIMPAALFSQFVESSPRFCSYLFHSFSTRLAVLLALVEAVSFSRLDKRLAQLLLSRGPSIQTTHSQLADELGTVREVVSRILKDFERQGFVQLERNRVQIVDWPALEKFSSTFNGFSY